MDKYERIGESVWNTYKTMGILVAEGLLGGKPVENPRIKHSPRAIKANLQRKVTNLLGTSRKKVAQGIAKGHTDEVERNAKGEGQD
jgi:hypothetical protein